MNTLPNDEPYPVANRRDSSGAGEETLRLIASIPAPEGLSDRVKERLRAAPDAGRIVTWRGPLISPRGWMYTSVARAAAAAAIVCVVAGGGWRIYSHVQPRSANAIETPPRSVQPSRGFSTSGATRLPGTLDPPVLRQTLRPVPEVNSIPQITGQAKGIPGGPVKKKKTPRPATATPK